MTNEELDTARAEEAIRLRNAGGAPHISTGSAAVAVIAARLAREGWKPEDRLLVEARKIAASIVRSMTGSIDLAAQIEGGTQDGAALVCCALQALRRGMEIAKP
jgi:hypothetical protein